MTIQEFKNGLGVLYEPIPFDGCWIWLGGIRRKGYGMVNINGKSEQAHRASYQISVGEIPQGLCVCHTCDNPPCVNPKHLFIGTHAENRRDAATKGRLPRGEKHSQAKLSEANVMDIVKLLAIGKSHSTIAGIFGVSASMIGSINRRENWTHILPAPDIEDRNNQHSARTGG